MDRVPEKVRAELRRFSMFVVIGTLSVALNLTIYFLLSRVAWPAGNHTLEYVITVTIVTWLNYEANRRFTFDAKQRSIGNMGRFATVAVIALGLNSTLFWFGHEVLHQWDLAVIVVATAIVASFTFTSHRFFTFHPDPWRHFKKKT